MISKETANKAGYMIGVGITAVGFVFYGLGQEKKAITNPDKIVVIRDTDTTPNDQTHPLVVQDSYPDPVLVATAVPEQVQAPEGASVRDRLAVKNIGDQFAIIDIWGNKYLVEKTTTKLKVITELERKTPKVTEVIFIPERYIAAVE